MKKSITILFILCISLPIMAQNTTFTWCFNKHGGLSFFSDGSTQPFPENNDNTRYEGSSILCDDEGTVIFYTNGSQIRDCNQIFGSTQGGFSSTQGSVIVPIPVTIPGSSFYKFLVFSTKAVEDGGAPNFSVCYVEVLSSGTPPYTYTVTADEPAYINNVRMSEKLATYSTSSGTWVIAHDFDPLNIANTFYVYHVNPDLFQNVESTSDAVTILLDSEVTQSIGSSHSGQLDNAQGQMKFSKDGSKLGLTIPVERKYEVFEFDSKKGKILDPPIVSAVLSPSEGYLYGCEFSPNGNFFYFTEGQFTTNYSNVRGIYQVDISTTPPSAPTTITSMFGTRYAFMSLQLGPNNKIYSTYDVDNPALSIINDPDQPGSGCNFSLNSVSIYGLAYFGLPSYVVLGANSSPNTSGCLCSSSTTPVSMTIEDKTTGRAHLSINLNSGSLLTSLVRINLTGFSVKATDEACKKFCEMGMNNMGVFVPTIPSLLSQPGEMTQFSENVVNPEYSNEIIWNLTTNPQIISNETIELNVMFPKISSLSCCNAEYDISIRITYLDAECKSCQELIYFNAYSEQSEHSTCPPKNNPSNNNSYTSSNYFNGISTENPASDAIMVYPNPTKSTINIVTNGLEQELPYTLFDSQGNTIKTGTIIGTSHIISLASESSGIYYLKIQSRQQEFNKKIILTSQ